MKPSYLILNCYMNCIECILPLLTLYYANKRQDQHIAPGRQDALVASFSDGAENW